MRITVVGAILIIAGAIVVVLVLRSLLERPRARQSPRRHRRTRGHLESRMPNAVLPDLLTPEEVAEITALSLDTFAQWRSQKRGIPYLKIGREVRYDAIEVQAYLESF